MQLFLDFLPVVAFFVAYKLANIYVATATLIAAVMVQAVVQWVRHRKLSPMMLTSAVLVLVFGTITLLVHDKTFIQWKPTVLYSLLAVAFLTSQFVGEAPLVERAMGTNMTLERRVWRKLNVAWVVFFVAMAALNLYVAYTFDEATWVNFKLFGLLGLTFVFAFAQAFWISSKTPGESTDATTQPQDRS
jgi:intracellular septation protein